jgi:hypothetical protein
MRTQRSFFWLVIIVVVLTALVLWHGKKKPIETTVALSPATDGARPAVSAARTRANASVHSNTPTVAHPASGAPAPTPPTETPTESKEQQAREGLAALNDVDIEFYGRLEDQFGNAVGDALIKFEVPFNNGRAVGVSRGTKTADGNGSFTISGYKGKSLSIVPAKAGYALASLNGGGIYSYLWSDSERVHPDRNNPTVIQMWKLQGAEPLVDISKEYKLPFTSVPIFFDLVAGKVVPTGGDLEVVVTRAPGPVSKKSPGDWSIDLKPVNGGILESDFRTAQITFEAPADGYQDNYLVQMNRDDPAWHDGFDRQFFLKSGDGRVYSKFYLVFGINREPNEPLYFQFRGVANANGSRNWEATAPQ